MAISEMRRVTVLGHESRMASTIDAIHGLGTLDISRFGEGMADEERSQWACPVDPTADIAQLDSIIVELKFAIDLMDKKRRVTKSVLENFTGSRLYLTDEEWAKYTTEAIENAHRIHREAQSIELALTEISETRGRLGTPIDALTPWRDLDIPLGSVASGKYIVAMLGTMPIRTYLGSLEDAAERVPGLAWQVVSEGKEQVQLLVAYSASAGDDTLSALSAAGFSRVAFDQYHGTPAQILSELQSQLDSLDTRLQQIEAHIDALAEQRPRAYALYDYLVNERAKLDIVNRFGGTHRTFVAEGWIQAKDMPEFRKRIEALSDDVVVYDREPSDDEVPPVELTNGKLAAPFEVVTKTMGLPKPGTLDPTPFLAPFFLVFFGVCMTDAVYGLFIAGVAVYLMRTVRAKGMGKQFIDLIFMCGLATVVMGALLGGWAGDLLTRLFGWRTAILFDPMESPTTFLIFAFALGVVQILFGICVKAYDNLRQGKWLSAIYDQLFWIVFLVSIGLALGASSLGPNGPAIAAVAKKVMLVSALGLIATQGRHQKNFFMRIGSGVMSLYSVTGYMSDVISYARLFGLGFTSTVLASVMNDLLLRPAGIPIVGPIIAIIGLSFAHLFNIAINIIGAYVHSSRLQYVEFFGKFFESGGRRFVPFGFSSKYVDVDTTKGA